MRMRIRLFTHIRGCGHGVMQGQQGPTEPMEVLGGSAFSGAWSFVRSLCREDLYIFYCFGRPYTCLP